MAITIRFSRQGKKHNPVYRVVVQDKAEHPKKRFIEVLGNFYPMNQQKPNAPQFQCDMERLNYWVSKGAQCSERVASLLKKQGQAVTASPETTSPEPASAKTAALKKAAPEKASPEKAAPEPTTETKGS